MPTRPKEHVVDTRATQLFLASIPPEWVVRNLSPDYGIDFQVEVFEDGEPTGDVFEVQLKGRSIKQRATNTHLNLSLSTKDLKKFLERTLPVFIVLVDISTSSTYWMSCEEAVSSLIESKSNWEMQQNNTINIPTKNSLPNSLQELTNVIKEANGPLRSIKKDNGSLCFSGGHFAFCSTNLFRKTPKPRFEFTVRVKPEWNNRSKYSLLAFADKVNSPDS